MWHRVVDRTQTNGTKRRTVDLLHQYHQKKSLILESSPRRSEGGSPCRVSRELGPRNGDEPYLETICSDIESTDVES